MNRLTEDVIALDPHTMSEDDVLYLVENVVSWAVDAKLNPEAAEEAKQLAAAWPRLDYLTPSPLVAELRLQYLKAIGKLDGVTWYLAYHVMAHGSMRDKVRAFLIWFGGDTVLGLDDRFFGPRL